MCVQIIVEQEVVGSRTGVKLKGWEDQGGLLEALVTCKPVRRACARLYDIWASLPGGQA